MSDVGQGFFYAGDPNASDIKARKALAQALLQKGLSDPGSSPYGGLSNSVNELLGAYLQRGANQADQKSYGSQIGSLIGSDQPNPVSVTPKVSTDSSGQPITPDPSLYNQPAESFQSGSLGFPADKAKMLATILKGETPDEGRQALGGIVSTALSPHGVDTVTLSNGQVQRLDKLTGAPIGDPIGPAKLLEMDPTKRYLAGDQPGQPPAVGATPPPQGVPVPTAAPPQGGVAPRAEDVVALVDRAIPGFAANVRGLGRTPAQNSAVGGVPNSAHLLDHAIDVHPAPGYTTASLQQAVNSLGLPNAKVIYEGPGAANSTAPHFHIQWAASAGGQPPQMGGQPSQTPQAPAGGIPGYHTVQEPQQIWRTITDPKDAARYNVSPGSQINTITGELKPRSMGDIPVNASDPAIQAAGANYWTKGGGVGGLGRDAASLRAIRAAAIQYGMQQNPGMTPEQAGVMLANNEVQFKGREHAITGFMGTGVNSPSSKITAANNAVGHLGTVAELANALQNGNVPLINAASLKFKQEFGYDAPTNYDALLRVVGPEVIKSIVPGGGGEAERNQVIETLSRRGSPQQLVGSIQQYLHAIGRQVYGTYLQYKANVPDADPNDFAKRFLAPDAAPYFLQSLQQANGTGAPAANPPAGAPPDGGKKIGRFIVTGG